MKYILKNFIFPFYHPRQAHPAALDIRAVRDYHLPVQASERSISHGISPRSSFLTQWIDISGKLEERKRERERNGGGMSSRFFRISKSSRQLFCTYAVTKAHFRESRLFFQNMLKAFLPFSQEQRQRSEPGPGVCTYLLVCRRRTIEFHAPPSEKRSRLFSRSFG